MAKRQRLGARTVLGVLVMLAAESLVAAECGQATTVPLITRQGIDVGTVTVRNDEHNLYVEFSASASWLLETTDFVLRAGGREERYGDEHDQTDSYTYAIELDWPPDTELRLKLDVSAVPRAAQPSPLTYKVQSCEPPLGNQGCTPGYWKNHTGSWPPSGHSTSESVESLFEDAGLYPGLASASLLEALSFGGGPGVEGAAEILLRAAVAAALNAAHPGVAYPRRVADVIDDVDAALASHGRDQMLALAAGLDADNNRGCPLH